MLPQKVPFHPPIYRLYAGAYRAAVFLVVSWSWLFALTIITGPTERGLYTPCMADIAM